MVSVTIVQFIMFLHDLINLSEGLKTGREQYFCSKLAYIWRFGVLCWIDGSKMSIVNTDFVFIKYNA